MTGRISEVSSASRLRLDMRAQRAAMVSESLTRLVGRRVARSAAPGSVMSDIEILLRGPGGGAARPGGMARQGQEYVVEGGTVHGEAPHRGAAWVVLIEDAPHVRGGSVGRRADGQAARVAGHHPPAEAAHDVIERRGVRQRQVQTLRRNLRLDRKSVV